jgi:hypothetical protein
MQERMSQFVVQQNRAEAMAYMLENRTFIAAARSLAFQFGPVFAPAIKIRYRDLHPES